MSSILKLTRPFFRPASLVDFGESIIENTFTTSRHKIHTSNVDMTRALVLACYQKTSDSSGNQKPQVPILTPAAAHFDGLVQGKLMSLVSQFGPDKKGKAKLFYGLHQDYPVVSVVGLGSPDAAYNEVEDIDEKRENIRSSIAIAAKSVRAEAGVDEVHFDACGDAEASAEGAHLALWYFDELKAEKYKKTQIKVGVYSPQDESVKQAFERGATLAKAQNHARRLMEMPANLMTPTIFCQTVQDMLKGLSNVKVVVHDRQWAEQKKMGSFLSVANGSEEPPKFLEIHYNNHPDAKPFVFVGKGICFDSGGISLKPGANMDKMRGDMGGAACVVSTVYALAALQAKVNLVALTPLTENMPSGKATKPGDVVYAMNGTSIQVDNTDAEGRLVLADALCYAHEFNPEAILDIATLTGAIDIALGSAVTAVFTKDSKLYDTIREAGVHTGDRVWRMPLIQHYRPMVTDSQLADTLNISKVARSAGSCTAAAFLGEFVKCNKWLHLDIAGVMESKDEYPYYCKGMSGRPTRTLFYFVNKFFGQ